MAATPVARAERLAGPVQLAGFARDLGRQISADHPDGVTLVGVLKGSVVFLSDLARQITVPTRLEFLAVAPYDGAAARTRVIKDLDRPVQGERVVLVTGIVDTGFTADFLLRHLRSLDPASVKVCTLADKGARRILPIPIDYTALEVPDSFLLGYGLDYAGRYRNLRDLWTADASALSENPDCHIDQLYGST